MFVVLPPRGGVTGLGRAAVTAVNHNIVMTRSYWSQQPGPGMQQQIRGEGEINILPLFLFLPLPYFL